MNHNNVTNNLNDSASNKNINTLKIMVVEDEKLARKHLIDIMNQISMPIQIIGEASSALEALELIEEDIPDILFTDIQMPYMDGLELSKLVLKKSPYIKIVILTAYREFNYAQKSIRIGISNFLLKPINHNDLIIVLEELQKQIQEERDQLLEFDSLKSILKENHSILRDKFLLELLDNSNSVSKKQLSYYYYPRPIPNFIQVARIEILSSTLLDYTEEEHLVQDMKYLEFLKNFLSAYSDIEVTVNHNHHMILFSYSEKVILNTICEQLQQTIHQLSGLDLYFGIGNAYNDIHQMTRSCQESLEDLKFNHYALSHSAAVYKSTGPVVTTTISFLPDYVDDVKFFIKAGLNDQLNDLLHSLYYDTNAGLADIDHTRLLSLTLLSAGINAVNEAGIPVHNLFEHEKDSFQSILSETISENLCHRTCVYLNKLSAAITTYRSNKCKTILWEVLQYVQKEMANPELSLNSIAEKFYMNTSYLSRVFKQELGFTFSKYLNRLRMEHALQLIDQTDLKVYQIAEAVGIPDAYYFSSCFKKYTGKSVRDYKKGI